MSRLNTGLTAFEFLFVLPTGSPLACDEAVIRLMKPPVRHSEDLVSGIKQLFLEPSAITYDTLNHARWTQAARAAAVAKAQPHHDTFKREVRCFLSSFPRILRL